ncbi:hypothetical protein CAOG_08787, partial [Capsaspora owczarzaki ATCC 30864]|uniref:hypothetical protein n=1 Tax=Capsaspora owczarzaki (strain ATCC 30864) TaxID=595528 RepID=UPI0003523493
IALAAACNITVGSFGPDLHVAEAALARSICGTRVEPDTRLTNTFTVAAAVSAGCCHLDNGVLKVPLYLFAARLQADLKAYPLSSLAHQLYLTLTEPGHEWEKFEVVVVILLQMRRIADSIETSNSGITVPGEPNWASGLHLNQITQSEFQSSADEARYPRTFNDVAKAHSRICGMKGPDGTDGLLMSSLDPAPAVAQEARSCIAGLAGAPIAEADQQARSRPLVEFIQTKHSLQDTTVSNTTIEGLYGKLARMATDQPFFSRSAPVLGIVTAARLGRTMNKYAIPNYCWLATREDLPALFGGFSDLVQAILSPNIIFFVLRLLESGKSF